MFLDTSSEALEAFLVAGAEGHRNAGDSKPLGDARPHAARADDRHPSPFGLGPSRCGRRTHAQGFATTIEQLWPPKPNEFDMATLTGRARATFGV